MFGLLTRSPRIRKPHTRRSTTLYLERLEDRLAPTTASSTESLTLNVTYLQDKRATFSGQLTDVSGSPVANQTINLTGVINATATTNSHGGFSITLAIPKLGGESASSADGRSNTPQVTLAGGNPVIDDFTAIAEGNGLWLFSGKVTGAPTQGEVVNFGGITPLQSQSTKVNSDGTFDFYAIVPSGEGGWASAEAVDWWGETSETAATFVNC